MLKLAYNVGLSIFSLRELLMKKSNDTFTVKEGGKRNFCSMGRKVRQVKKEKEISSEEKNLPGV